MSWFKKKLFVIAQCLFPFLPLHFFFYPCLWKIPFEAGWLNFPCAACTHRWEEKLLLWTALLFGLWDKALQKAAKLPWNLRRHATQKRLALGFQTCSYIIYIKTQKCKKDLPYMGGNRGNRHREQTAWEKTDTGFFWESSGKWRFF